MPTAVKRDTTVPTQDVAKPAMQPGNEVAGMVKNQLNKQEDTIKSCI